MNLIVCFNTITSSSLASKLLCNNTLLTASEQLDCQDKMVCGKIALMYIYQSDIYTSTI